MDNQNFEKKTRFQNVAKKHGLQIYITVFSIFYRSKAQF